MGRLTSDSPRRPMGIRQLPLAHAIGISLLLVTGATAQAPMMSVDSARHVLSRLSYGALPGEVEAVAREGVLKWVDRQLGELASVTVVRAATASRT